jgi:hypothetical protein
MGGTDVVVATRICPHCHQPTRIGWPMCDGCARSLPAYRPLPDLRLIAELDRWDRATRRALKWLWAAVIVCCVLDLRYGRDIGPVNSVWDDLAVGSLLVALAATLLGIVAVAVFAGRDPAPAWRRERASLRRRLGIGTPADP